MRAARAYLAGLLLLSPALVGAACEDSQRDENCNDNDCVCSGGGCQCRPEIQACTLECEKDCGLVCERDHVCDFACGADCSVQCGSSGTCRAEVGRRSSIRCDGAKGCTVTCQETCSVQCQSKEPCAVQCKLHAAQSCPGNVIACGDCP
ncbi:MAG TPA: hypothetical protein PKA88_16195 [Polyangiaceae bacterium]|nr:hypothetical protein [Polyangiaceae bacterium]HMR73595.1 hypothetical protein [Polyangiaceae bacterium]